MRNLLPALAALSLLAGCTGLIDKPPQDKKQKFTAKALKSTDAPVSPSIGSSTGQVGGLVEIAFIHQMEKPTPRLRARAKFFDPVDAGGKPVQEILSLKGSKDAGEEVVITGRKKKNGPAAALLEETDPASLDAIDAQFHDMISQYFDEYDLPGEDALEAAAQTAEPARDQEPEDPDDVPLGASDIKLGRRSSQGGIYYEFLASSEYDLPIVMGKNLSRIKYLAYHIPGGADVTPAMAADGRSPQAASPTYFHVDFDYRQVAKWALGRSRAAAGGEKGAGATIDQLESIDRAKPLSLLWDAKDGDSGRTVDVAIKRKDKFGRTLETLEIDSTADDGEVEIQPADLAKLKTGAGFVLITRIYEPRLADNKILVGGKPCGILSIMRSIVIKQVQIK